MDCTAGSYGVQPLRAQVGLTGRGAYGHFAGAIPYAEYFLSGGGFSFDTVSSNSLATEVVTPMSVVMAAHEATADIAPMSPFDWMVFQLPLPHIFSFTGRFSLDLTRFLGGEGAWGYTPSMFGDTFAHLGWLGSLAFVYMGFLYRLLERLILSAADDLTVVDAQNFLIALLPIGYYAFLLGTFNNYRSWNSTITFGSAITLFILWLLGKVTSGRTEYEVSYSPEQAAIPPSQ